MIKLNKSELQEMYEQIMRLVKRKPAGFFSIKKMRKVMGLCFYAPNKASEYDENVILVDYRREFVGTFLHELVHYLYPDQSETWVLYAEKRLLNFCSTLQIASFLKLISNKLYKAEMSRVFSKKNKCPKTPKTKLTPSK
jgi:hypothetical protein